MAELRSISWICRAVLFALFLAPVSLVAQEVVQPLPPKGSDELNSALQRLARDAGDVDALLDAGEAAIQLGDIPAAIGFFGRAQDLAPDNPRVPVGLANAYTLSRRPIEALRLFAEAERAGVAPVRMAARRGLAFDLVGDAASAQSLYRLALSKQEDPETRRNLAFSQAISGDKSGFEAALLPLLHQGDKAAFRTRAFGLAVLGETDAAVKIARDMMPGQMAAQVEPYLRYMPQLTQAQQAAAGALGVFPHNAAIGRDDPAIATYESNPARISDVRRSEQKFESTEQVQAVPATGAPTSTMPSRSAAELQPVAAPASPIASPQTSQVASVPALEPSVADAFASFDTVAISKAPRAGAVDITRIDVPREVETPPPPAHPARHWVQVATGQDISALGFDWRRISRKAEGALEGKGPFFTPWGEANRLLSGPYESSSAARDMVNRLNKLGIDSFPFSSDEGQEITPLK